MTITRNDLPGFRATIASILEQSCACWEMLICDGGSTVGTVEGINLLCEKDNRLKLISREDKGIYDAMNKGLSAANGDYIIFLNGGDVFSRPSLLADFLVWLPEQPPDLVFGDVLVYDRNSGFSALRKGDVYNEHPLRGIMPPHQGLFIRKEIISEVGLFNLSYKIAGDFEWYVRARKKRLAIKYWNTPVAIFSLDGVSTFSGFKQERERLAALVRHYGRMAAMLYLPFATYRISRAVSRVGLNRLGLLSMWRNLKKNLKTNVG